MMNRLVVLALLITLGIAFSSAGVIELLGPLKYSPNLLVAQSDFAEKVGPLHHTVGETKIIRRKRAFNTYITAFCYSPQVTIFDFSKKNNS